MCLQCLVSVTDLCFFQKMVSRVSGVTRSTSASHRSSWLACGVCHSPPCLSWLIVIVSHLWRCPRSIDLPVSKPCLVMPAGALLMLKPGDQCTDGSPSSSGCQTADDLCPPYCCLLRESCLPITDWHVYKGGYPGQRFLLEELTPHIPSFVKWGSIHLQGCSRHSPCFTHIFLALTISVHVDLTFYCQHLHFFSPGLSHAAKDCSADKHGSRKCQ